MKPLRAPTPDGRVVDTEIRVRYAETDAMGVAHHTSYFVWFEAGRTEYTRAMGLPYRQLEERGVRLVVVEAAAQFHRPARYDDRVTVRTWVQRVSKATLTFAYQVLLPDGAPVADGHTVHAATDLQGRVRRLPDDVLQALGDQGR